MRNLVLLNWFVWFIISCCHDDLLFLCLGKFLLLYEVLTVRMVLYMCASCFFSCFGETRFLEGPAIALCGIFDLLGYVYGCLWFGWWNKLCWVFVYQSGIFGISLLFGLIDLMKNKWLSTPCDARVNVVLSNCDVELMRFFSL